MGSDESVFGDALHSGTIKWFNRAEGYGWITPLSPRVREVVREIRSKEGREKRKSAQLDRCDVYFRASKAQKSSFRLLHHRNRAGGLWCVPPDTPVSFRLERLQKKGGRLLHAVDVQYVGTESS